MTDYNNVYWASVPSNEIADNMMQKVEKYYEFLQLSGRLDLYRRTWSYYYRTRLTGAKINPTGQQGELTALSVNHFRNFLVHLETMTTQQRLSFDARATNNDVVSMDQAILANSLLDYYMREKKIDRNTEQAVKDGLMFGEGFITIDWDATAGKEYGKTATGAIVYEGDLRYRNYQPLDVVRDFTQNQKSNLKYVILRDFENKYELAAKYPALSNQILDDQEDDVELARMSTINVTGLFDENDNVTVLTLMHDITPAMPQGRFTRVLRNGTVLLDGPLPYDKMHVYRLAPDEESGTIFGYTVGFDLLPIQESLDILYSTILTNQSTFGVQNILVPKGHDLSVSQITGGMNLIEYDKQLGAPEALNLTNTPAEIFNFMTTLEKLGETISGVNSVARGDPGSSLKSGAALALIQSQAVQFSQNLQKSYIQLVEDLGTATINILKTYAAVPRVAVIVGKSNRSKMKSFTGEDLGLVDRVLVDAGNPVTRTTAGKVNLAETLMSNGLIVNGDQYIQVMTTGRLEPVIEGKQAQMLLIKGENEHLADGLSVRALVTDDHQKHILEHTVVLSNPEIRNDPNNPIVIETLAHIQEHMMMMGNPYVQQLAAVLHQENIPGQMQAPQAGQAMSPDASQPQLPNMPNPPKAPAGTDPQSAQVIQEQGQQVEQSIQSLPQ